MKTCSKCSCQYEGSVCKPCRAAYMRQWNQANPDKVKASKKKKYAAHKAEDNARSKAWAQANPEKSGAIKKAWKLRNRESYLAQQREYAKKRYESNRVELLAKDSVSRTKEPYRTWREKNRERLSRESLEKYHASEDAKFKASVRGKLRRALQAGKLVKPDMCSNCNEPNKVEAHHNDYSKPLEVTWLCCGCHKKIHSKFFNKGG